MILLCVRYFSLVLLDSGARKTLSFYQKVPYVKYPYFVLLLDFFLPLLVPLFNFTLKLFGIYGVPPFY
jgi:hypothetical protein